ncbi:tyrosine-type recombinase/integrase [Sunxiuqinia indica]|uniref:tyrosine-type recombinase/integrase n=1 Tax=Sunxiuqinia indica TaxID=2692584 RepID=UPI001356EDE1|nr:tyrosine-type recombinase/integrase [Sunxiuqinia indica]
MTRAIQGYDEFGHYPNKILFRPTLYRKCGYTQLNDNFKTVVDNYKLAASKTEKRPTTIHAEAVNCSSFLFAMQKRGANELSEITETHILSFFYDGKGLIRSRSYRDNIKAVLKANKGFESWEECNRIIGSLPEIKARRKNFQFLEDTEIAKIKSCLTDDDSEKITLRDKAIISVAMYTGMRGSDIASMCVSDIDWRRDQITLTQSKTGAPLTLPLRAVVGNAIFDYIKHERINNGTISNLFVNAHCPDKMLEIRSVGCIATRFLAKLDIRANGGERGIRLFRHYIASKLLENGAQVRVISDILGHLSPESINPYIDADLKHLRECSLSIEMFPLGREVLP